MKKKIVKRKIIESKSKEVNKPKEKNKIHKLVNDHRAKFMLVGLLILLVILSVALGFNEDQDTTVISKLSNNSNELLSSNKQYMVGTPELIKITSDNLTSLKVNYSFLFADTIADYGFEVSSVGDYIVVYPSLIISYNYKEDKVNNLFFVSSIVQ